MCNYCEALKKCPAGEKRRVIIAADAPGELKMVLDRYEGYSIGILTASFTAGGFWHNMPIHIRYCPVCGEKLAEDVILPLETEEME